MIVALLLATLTASVSGTTMLSWQSVDAYYRARGRTGGSGANNEVILEIEALHAEWDAAKRQLHVIAERTLTVARDHPLTLYLAVRSKS